MKFLLVTVGVCLGLCSCKDKASRSSATPPPKPQSAQTSSTAVAPPTKPDGTPNGPVVPTPVPSKPLPTATAGQIASVVRVQVSAVGLRAKNYTGALLHREELVDAGTYFNQNRCVLALLKGWTEAQLRSQDSSIMVFRNLPNAQGDPKSMAYTGRLAQLDPQTGLAAITFSQGFSSETDLGFRIRRAPAPDDSGIALRFVAIPGEQVPSPVIPLQQYGLGGPGSRMGRVAGKGESPMTLLTGSFSATGAASGALKFPDQETGRISDEAPLVTTSPATLIGFISENAGAPATLVAAKPVVPPFNFLTVKPVSLTWADGPSSTAKVAINVETGTGEKMPMQMVLKTAKLDAGAKMDLASLKEPFAPITATKPDHLITRAGIKTVEGSLDAPTRKGDEFTYLMQLGWKEFDEEIEPSRFSRPFIIRVARTYTVTARTEGIANLNEVGEVKDEPGMPKGPPVIGVFEIAGGREVLMQFKGEPFWKRFSMEKKTWLPLPPVNLSEVDMAGNRSRLFVLDRGAAEVRSYNLMDLSPAGSAKVNDLGDKIFSIRAGCNSDRAPVYLLTNKGIASLTADTLSQTAFNNSYNTLTPEGRYVVTGDGMTLMSDSLKEAGLLSRTKYMTYSGDYLGMQFGYFDVNNERRIAPYRNEIITPSHTVSAAYGWLGLRTCANPLGEWENMPGPPPAPNTGAKLFNVPNAPIMIRYTLGNKTVTPAIPPRVALFSFFDSEAFAEVDFPELLGIAGNPEHRICFDPFSKRLGIMTPDAKTWIVREVTFKEDRQQPVLLNWPETSLARGGEFQFTPLILGKGTLSAELLGPKETTPVKVDEKSISFRVAANEFASLLLLNLKVTGADGKSLSYPIPLYVKGAAGPYVSPAVIPETDPEWLGSGFKTLTNPKTWSKAPDSTLYLSPNPIIEIYGPVAGHLGLHTDARQVDFLSMATKKVVGSVQCGEKVKFYPGGGALFEYDAEKRSFTRISVPEGRREKGFTLPEGFGLLALAIGAERDQPLTLFLERLGNQKGGQIGNYTITDWQDNGTTLVVNSETLLPGGWMQPVLWTEKPGPAPMYRISAFGSWAKDYIPKRVSGLQNGSILQLEGHLMVLSPKYSLAAPYPGNKDPFARQSARETIVTPYGRYQLVRGDAAIHPSRPSSDPHGNLPVAAQRAMKYALARSIEIRTLGDGRPLFRLNRLSPLYANTTDDTLPVDKIRLLQDNGSLLFRVAEKRGLLFVDLDIPRLALEIQPQAFHVISQPTPIAVEGGTYQYQLQVNNPGMVSLCRLRTRIANANISPSGMFRYTPPQNVRKPEQVDFSIELVGRDGKIVSHEFPLIVLPRKIPGAK